MANKQSIWGGIRAGLTYEQNALLRAYGAATYEDRERALDGIATDILERVTSSDERRRALHSKEQADEN